MRLDNRGLIVADVIVAVAIMNIVAVFITLEIIKAKVKVKVSETKIQLSEIHKAIWLMKEDTQYWPGHISVEVMRPGWPQGEIWELNQPRAGLVKNDYRNPYPNWQGPYIKFIPKDPWGSDYFFDPDYTIRLENGQLKRAIVIGSFGPNQVSQSIRPDDTDDIVRVMQ